MDIFSNFQVANECLLDKQRTSLFQKAIQRVVKKGDIVLDAGTGTGILAMFAAQAGANKVYACDIAEDILSETKKTIATNGYNNTIEMVHTDIKALNHIKNVDVLIMEMLDTGLIAEQQGAAIQALKQNSVVTEQTKFIPYKVENYVEAIEYDFTFYGFSMPAILQARNFGTNKQIKKKLSKVTRYQTVEFNDHFDTNVSETFILDVQEEGLWNALRLRTKTFLVDSLSTWGTSDMNMPVIIPIEPLHVKVGDSFSVHISYKMGEGFEKLSYLINRL